MTIPNQAKTSVAVRFAVLTVSDTRTELDDTSGRTLIERIEAAGHVLAARRIVTDEPAAIRDAVEGWMADPAVEVVIATGGTGLTGRDVTTDVFEGLFDKAIPGFGELFRQLSFRDIGVAGIMSRATGGLARGTLLFALPGSTGACRTAWDEILVHLLNRDTKPCNLVAMMPRFEE